MPPTTLLMEELPFKGQDLERLVAALGPDHVVFARATDSDAVRDALQVVEIAILPGDLDDRHLAAPRLKWVHCDHAGLTRSARPEVFDKGLLVTGSAGRSGPALAEHAMMFALLLAGRYPMFAAAQRDGVWLRTPEMADLHALAGRTMGIVGLGNTGSELAVRAKAFGMRVLAFRRRDSGPTAHVDQVFSADRGESLDAMLPACDVLALTVNLSNATRSMVGARQLALLPAGAMVINMARGEVLDQDALVAALRSGHLSGAGLDVTTPEPLPLGHPLWHEPNVLITPHFTPTLRDRSARSLAIILENIRRYRAGEPMLNAITPADVYQS